MEEKWDFFVHAIVFLKVLATHAHIFVNKFKLSGKPFYSLSLNNTLIDPVVSFLCLGEFYVISMEMLISFQHIQTSQSSCHIIILTNHY